MELFHRVIDTAIGETLTNLRRVASRHRTNLAPPAARATSIDAPDGLALAPLAVGVRDVCLQHRVEGIGVLPALSDFGIKIGENGPLPRTEMQRVETVAAGPDVRRDSRSRGGGPPFH